MPTPMEFDHEAMAWLARRVDPSIALKAAWPAPDWPAGLADLLAIFALGDGEHFLKHHRGLLPQLWERQITKALRALLLEAPDRTLERCQALLIALEGPHAVPIVAIDRITADDADRMDLAIHCRDHDGVPHCVVIEAKLDSDLSRGQLSAYRKGLLKRYPSAGQRHLWVVAPRRSARTAHVMLRLENAEWKFMTWRRLMLNWQRALPDAPGHDALSLFGEIWKRVGGR